MALVVLQNILKQNYSSSCNYVSKLSSETINSMIKDLSENSKNEYLVFTDGGCLKNGKEDAKAGFSVHFENHPIFGTTQKLEKNPTNNAAELSSILYSFNIINTNFNEFIDKKVVIVSDSMYSIKCINTWSKKWLQNGFKTSVGKDVLNKELIAEILNVKQEIKEKDIDISFQHVFSHQPAPQDKESIEYKIWFFNNLVDTNISTLLKE